jgi:RHS repeat-associated protein
VTRSVAYIGSGTFKYDPFGRRIEKISPTATSVFAYDDDSLVETVNSSGGVVARYTQMQNIDEPLVALRSSGTEYYEADWLGSITSLTNSAGAVANTYTYDSFGNITNSTGTLGNPFRFTGHEFDTETGLYNYRARYLDSTTGRFLSEDPLGLRDNLDMYIYVGNNPTAYDDPFGLYELKGFTPAQQVLMIDAINEALAKLRTGCPNCGGQDGLKVANAIEGATFIYNSKMSPKACAETGPLSFLRLRHVVSIGPLAFEGLCCTLPSVVAHEAVHLTGGGESKAYNLQITCFGCTQYQRNK